jgi:hypothetical protein
MVDEKPSPEDAAAHGQKTGVGKPSAPTSLEASPASGRRHALRELRRELSDDDLKSPGTQKMLLDELGRADAECESLRSFVPLYHEADKHAAVLEERLRTHTALEVMFGVGVGIGGALIGVAPSIWDSQPQGYLALGLGTVLLVGAAVGRVVKR